ncbi:MAG: TRAP transporter large permease [Burkholderiaceae bacterium]
MFEPLVLIVSVYLAGLALGLPVFFVVAAIMVVYAIAFPVMPPVVVGQLLTQGLDRGALVAVPAFMLAGALMNAGGMTDRLVRVALALTGPFRGGLAHANIGASILFGGISGSAAADVAAVGSVMVPAMAREGYPPAYAAAVTASSATIGLLIPPSLSMVFFGLFNNAPVDALFVAGVVPGLLMGVYLLVVSAMIARRRGYPSTPFTGWRELAAGLRQSVLALLMPVAVIVAMSKGLATVNEVASLSAVYALLVSMFVYRTLSLRELWPVVRQAAIDSARLLSILAAAGGIPWILANLGASEAMSESIAAIGLSQTALLGLVALLLVLIGTMVGPGVQILLIAPAISPVMVGAGIDIVHFGVVCVLASAIGLVTPPVGFLLFLTSTQARVGVLAVVRESLPFTAALLALLASLVAFPSLSLGLGRWLS